MSTKPNEKLIPNPNDNPKVMGILCQYSSLIAETVNFGSLVLQWSSEVVHTGDHHLAAFTLFRHSLELVDSISVLIKNSCISPCKILLRSQFEAMLSLEYLMQSDFERRGKDYILCYKHETGDDLRKHLKDDPLHRKYIGRLENDECLRNMKSPDIPYGEIENAIKSKERIFKSASYADGEASYQEKKAKRKGQNPSWWFSLRGGPKNIWALADKMNRPAQYDFLYRKWSGYLHGTGCIDEYIEIGKGEIAILQLRVPKDAEHITFMAISFALTVMNIMIQEYAKDKKKYLAQWYRAEVRAGYFDLKRKRIIVD